MTKTRFTLSDLGHALPERALLAFVRHLPESSLVARDAGGDEAWRRWEWARQEPVPWLLAGVVDELRNLQYVVAQSATKERLDRPRRIPRPGVDDDRERIGSGAIPASEWDAFWEGGDDGQR